MTISDYPGSLSFDGTAQMATIPADGGTVTVDFQATWPPVVIEPIDVQTAVVGTAFELALEATGGDGAYTWSLSAGSLLEGLELGAGGAITGTPTAAESVVVTVCVTSGDGQVAELELSLSSFDALEIATVDLEDAVVESPYADSVVAAGGSGELTWTIADGALPDGLDLEAVSGRIRGVATTPGTFDFTIGVASGDGQSDREDYSVRVVLHPSSFCSDHTEAAVATFADGAVEQALRTSLGLGAGEAMTCGLLPTVTELDLQNAGVESILGLQNVTNLRVLSMYRNNVRDVGPLAGLSRLERLYLGENAVSDLEPLRELTSLSFLSVNTNQVTDIEPLRGLTQLEFLALGNNGITDLSAVSGMIRLDDLSFENNAVTDLSPLAGLTGVAWLEMANNEITDLSPLSGTTELVRFSAVNNSIVDLDALSGNTQMRWMFVAGNRITDVSAVVGMTSLELLWASSNEIADVTPLAGLPMLDDLLLNRNQITQVGSLAGLTTLVRLRLGANPIVDLTPLAGLSSLETLGLMQMGISDLSPISELSRLSYLFLSSNELTDIGSLAGLMRLERVDLDANLLTDIGVLQGLVELDFVKLDDNADLSSLQPLLDNPGIGDGDRVDVLSTAVSCADVAALEAKGVFVQSNCF